MGFFRRRKKAKPEHDNVESKTETRSEDDATEVGPSVDTESTGLASSDNTTTPKEDFESGKNKSDYAESDTHTGADAASSTAARNTNEDNYDYERHTAKNAEPNKNTAADTSALAKDVAQVDAADQGLVHNDASLSATNSADEQQSTVLSERMTELATLTKKIQSVKDEYNVSVRDLMNVKKDLHQKKDDLKAAVTRLEKLENEIVENGDLSSKTAADLEQKQKDLAKVRDDLEQKQKEYDNLVERLDQERHALTVIKTQQSEVEKDLEAANARLYNAKAELESSEQFQDPSVFTDDEKAVIIQSAADGPVEVTADTATPVADVDAKDNGTDQKVPDLRSHASVVEAAGIVVASLKSKLKTAQNELEAVHLLLKQEREQHDVTKRQLASFLEGKDD